MEEKVVRKQFAEEKVVEIFLLNGAVDYGRTKFVPFVKDDFGSTYLEYKDVNGTWHNIKVDAINFMRVYSAETFEKFVNEQQELSSLENETPALTDPINNNVTIKEDEEW